MVTDVFDLDDPATDAPDETPVKAIPPRWLIPAAHLPAYRALQDALLDDVPPCVSSPDLFFDRQHAATAATVCADCHAIAVCRTYGRGAGERGTWGGEWL